jgi:hypothetical protein
VSGTADLAFTGFVGCVGIWMQRGAFVCVGVYDVLDKFDQAGFGQNRQGVPKDA